MRSSSGSRSRSRRGIRWRRPRSSRAGTRGAAGSHDSAVGWPPHGWGRSLSRVKPDNSDQSASTVKRHFAWGLAGAHRLAAVVDALVVVDVLSYSTAVDIALGRGASVRPAPGGDPRGTSQTVNAVHAVGRSATTPSQPFSLSPASLLALPAGVTLVLTSPNGGTIAAAVAERGIPTFLGGFRNARTVARAASEVGERVGVIAAGERWGDGRLRPALEDIAGAGAILTELDGASSPEAALAMHVGTTTTIEALADCTSARELRAIGFQDDVSLALMRDVSSAVPFLAHGEITNRAAV